MTYSTALFRLDGKVALVTGGAGVLGRPLSRALAEAGATVIVASRDEKKCQSFAQACQTEDLKMEGEALDLTSSISIRALRERIQQRHKRLDILFNNAVARGGGDPDHTTAEEWEATMKVNSTGLFLSCQVFSELMRTQGGGSIVNIASVYGVVGPTFSVYEGTRMTNPVFYAFAKGGIIGLTRYLASFLAPFRIRVNCLSPGGVATDEMPMRFRKQYSEHTLLGRMADEDDIKGPALFLASDASRYITGQNLVVDGGWTAICKCESLRSKKSRLPYRQSRIPSTAPKCATQCTCSCWMGSRRGRFNSTRSGNTFTESRLMRGWRESARAIAE